MWGIYYRPANPIKTPFFENHPSSVLPPPMISAQQPEPLFWHETYLNFHTHTHSSSLGPLVTSSPVESSNWMGRRLYSPLHCTMDSMLYLRTFSLIIRILRRSTVVTLLFHYLPHSQSQDSQFPSVGITVEHRMSFTRFLSVQIKSSQSLNWIIIFWFIPIRVLRSEKNTPIFRCQSMFL